MQNTTGKKSKKKTKKQSPVNKQKYCPFDSTGHVCYLVNATPFCSYVHAAPHLTGSESEAECHDCLIFESVRLYLFHHILSLIFYFGWVGYIVNCFIICLIQVFWHCCAVDLRRMFHIEASCVFALCGSPVWLPVLLKLLCSAWNSCGPLLSKIDLARINRGAEALLGCCW